ncbi:MAG TPA: protein-methionine-sulfoxide reductase catalytic subunit MsrP [Phycisphaerae bacterium]|nr:protein-methionine-sulfoxide reductase catalytic subunit MsrP [Phycisphaerae bacterium]
MADVPKIPSSEITPEGVYMNRRTFMKAGILAGTAAATGLAYRAFNHPPLAPVKAAPLAGVVAASGPADSGFWTTEPRTPFETITHYNNFYEFSTGKQEVAEAAAGFRTEGWKVEVGGLVSKPRTFDLDDLKKISPPEERVYRMRCVEAWSMVIPWAGFSVSKVLEKVAPLGSAKFVAFQTLMDPQRFPGQRDRVLNWPYVEGLRMDEAMHPLAMLATGLYGRELPAQDGAPVRLVVPWKYGFKGIKSIVKITLVEEEPPTSWNEYSAEEYGFYANVNPNHDHPRWSQATERRFGPGGSYKEQPTLMFNGYEEQVAGMYAGMDLDVNF